MVFNNNLHIAKDFTKGFVSTLDLDRKFFSEGMLSDMLNLDITQAGLEKRAGYKVAFNALEEYTNLELKNFFKRTFYDNNGTAKDVLILVYYDTTAERYRIFSKGYYNPLSTYDNYYNAAAGVGLFNNDLIELTQYFGIGDFVKEDNTLSGIKYNYKILTADLTGNDPFYTSRDNALKGFYVFNATDIVGFVDYSKIDGTYTYIQVLLDGSDLTNVGMCRFPVTFQFRDKLFTDNTNLLQFSFCEFDNCLKIYTGDRPLQVQFIKDRISLKYASFDSITYSETLHNWFTGTNITSTEIATYIIRLHAYDNIHEIWISKNGNAEYLLDYFVDLGEFDYVGGDYLYGGIYFTISILAGEIVDNETVSFTATVYNKSWNGFWFDYDNLQVDNKKAYGYYKTESAGTVKWIESDIADLGIKYKLSNATGTGCTKNDNLYSLVVELDMYQNIFVKNILCQDKRVLDIYFYLKPFFNRRISGSLLFGANVDALDLNTLKDNELPDTFKFDDTVPGYIIFRDRSFIKTDNLFYTPIVGITQFPETYAKGVSLSDFLNHVYYRETVIKCKGGINLGGLNLVYGISNDFVQADDLINKSNAGLTGDLSVCLSQVQNGVNCHSVFSTKRLLSLGKTEITALAQTVGYQFLMFTKDKIQWYEISNIVDFGISEVGNYDNYPVNATSDLVRASYTENAGYGTASWEFGAKEFNGVFFKNDDSVYYIMNNKPVDLLYGIWKKYYQSLNKSGSVIGYYPKRNEIWIMLNVSENPLSQEFLIFIFSLASKNWKIYQFLNNPLMFHHFNDGTIFFSDQESNVFEFNHQDLKAVDCTDINIPISFQFITNFNSLFKYKTLDKYEFSIYKEFVSGLVDTECVLSIADNNGNQLLDRVYSLNNARFKGYSGLRIAMDYLLIDFEIENTENLSRFVFNFMQLNIKEFKK